MQLSTGAVSFAIALAVMPAGVAQDAVDGFVARSFTARDGRTLRYRLFLPHERVRRQPLPIIVYLHGGGGVGLDNIKQISGGNTTGTHVWTKAEIQARHPAYVLAPQLPPGEPWAMPATSDLAPYAAVVVELLEALATEMKIDLQRVYLTGQSLGGRGTWDIVSKRPGLFAAAVPLCGDGNASRVVAARDVPIWAFHGAQDEVVPVKGSRDLVAALRAAGSAVKYTEYPSVEHDVWVRAYAERELLDWLFAQRRRAP